MAIMKIVTKNAPQSGYCSKYKDEEAYQTLIRYVFNPEKTNGVVGGWAVSLNHPDSDMRLVTRLYHKENGVFLRHWIVSFQVDEINQIAMNFNSTVPRIMGPIGYALTAFYKDRHQIVFGAHWKNETSPHIHIVMNTVSYMDGLKFDGNREEYHSYERYIKSILGSFGTEVYIMKDHVSTK